MNNTVCIDWLSVTVKTVETNPCKAIKAVIEELLQMDFDKFAIQNFGINKYNCHFACGDIKIYYSQNEYTGLLSDKMGIFVQMTGVGCRQYEEYLNNNINNWVELVKRFLNMNANFTRIDIANDIYNNLLDVQQIYEYCKKGLCISKSKKYEYHETGILENGQRTGETINIGAKGSDGQQLGIYNKLMERMEAGKLSKSVDVWVRAELRLFGKRANACAVLMSKRKPLRDIYFEIVNASYRFVLQDEFSTDKNKWRRSTVQWWIDYIATKEKTELRYTREKPTLRETEKFLDKQVAKSLTKVYKAKELAEGTEEATNYILSLLSEGEKKLTNKDIAEIEQYVEEQKNEKLWTY